MQRKLDQRSAVFTSMIGASGRRWPAGAAALIVLFFARIASAQVVLTEAIDEGRECFKIVTDTVTYFYDKAGAGFTSLVDRDGHDWIGFHREGAAPNGQSGWYRGIPNMALDAFGHPGYEGAISESADARGVSLPAATIVSRKGGWKVSWSFHATHAKMTILTVEENYWLLYEGTPGGAVGSDDRCVSSDGQEIALDRAFERDITPSPRLPGVEWVYFADGAIDRALFFAHDDESQTDRYYLMDPMTVFGFGRRKADLDRLLDATPATLVIGLVDSRRAEVVEARIAEAFGGARSGADGSLPSPDAGAPPHDRGLPSLEAAASAPDGALQNDAGLPVDGSAPRDFSLEALASAPPAVIGGDAGVGPLGTEDAAMGTAPRLAGGCAWAGRGASRGALMLVIALFLASLTRCSKRRRRTSALMLVVSSLLWPLQAQGRWESLSSATGDLPALPYSAAVSTLVFDVDRDGVDDIVVAGWNRPGMVWYRRSGQGWELYLIEDVITNIEAGGAFFDVDGDGDLDIVQGAHDSSHVWWWENPYPAYAPSTPWKARTIKSDGGKKHHDQLFGDFDGDGRVELVFWNNDVNALFLAEIPSDPRQSVEWPRREILSLANAEGLAKADIDGDGVDDIVGAGRWLKHAGGGTFSVELIDTSQTFTRVAAGQLVAGGRAEVVFGTGDKPTGQLVWYEYVGDQWVSHVLQDPQEYGHTLQLADVDGDGNLDVFAAEVEHGTNSDPKVWLFYGDGEGGFRKETVSTGVGVHEGRIGDLDGDGDLDIVGKNFRTNMPRIDVWLQNGTDGVPWHYIEVDNSRRQRAFGLAFGDVNGDGRKDIASGAYVYLNPGQDLTAPWARQTLPGGVDASLVVDVDGDAFLDLIAQRLPDVLWLEATDETATSWSSRVIGSVPETAHGNSQGYVLAAIDGSQRSQILIAGADGDGIYSFTIPADPKDPWPRTKIAQGTSEEMIGVGDIDGDQRVDIVASNSTGSGNVAWFKNPGDGSANWQRQVIGTAINPQGVVVADLNGDGKLDVAVTEETDSATLDAHIYWYQQSAPGSWTRHLVGVRYSSFGFDAADIDGDGDVDLISGENIVGADDGREQTIIWENDGSGRWAPYVVDEGKESHLGSRAVDLDGDGDREIVSIAWSTYRFLHLWRNDALGAVAPSLDAATPPAGDGGGSPRSDVGLASTADAGAGQRGDLTIAGADSGSAEGDAAVDGAARDGPSAHRPTLVGGCTIDSGSSSRLSGCALFALLMLSLCRARRVWRRRPRASAES